MKICHSLWTSTSTKRGLWYQTNLLYLTEVQLDIPVFPFVQNKDYQYSDSHLDNTSLFFKQREVSLITKKSASRGV